MFHLCLINMPFAALRLPSLALTQLKSVLETRFAGQISIDICYLNHDFAHYIGKDLYETLGSMDHHTSGLGDWSYRTG